MKIAYPTCSPHIKDLLDLAHVQFGVRPTVSELIGWLDTLGNSDDKLAREMLRKWLLDKFKP
jgi:hypothetical protein